MKIFNLDARKFVKDAITLLPKGTNFDHVVMNLPASSLEFISDLISTLQEKQIQTEEQSSDSPVTKRTRENHPIVSTAVHCYLFARDGENPLQVCHLEIIIFIDGPG